MHTIFFSAAVHATGVSKIYCRACNGCLVITCDAQTNLARLRFAAWKIRPYGLD